MRRTLYPIVAPWDQGHLRVSRVHEVYYEQCGDRQGKPALFIHGGPGGGCSEKHRGFFDPARYRVVLFDQRGCGRSRPHASLEENNTWALVEDMERLRIHLGIERWMLFGGSWGSTLALAYAIQHPDRVSELVLRGIFTFTTEELRWFYGEGTRALFPDAWEDFIAPIPPAERHDLIGAYHRRLTDPDPTVQARFAQPWSLYECRVAALEEEPGVESLCKNVSFTLPFARIESHYFVHNGFLDDPDSLLEGARTLGAIPTTIVHGRYDVICPVQNAWRLKQRMPHADLQIVPASGHSAFEPNIISALVRATDGYAAVRPDDLSPT